ncbi:hypothetical protein AgCh_002228 [Apium graveolens]
MVAPGGSLGLPQVLEPESGPGPGHEYWRMAYQTLLMKVNPGAPRPKDGEPLLLAPNDNSGERATPSDAVPGSSGGGPPLGYPNGLLTRVVLFWDPPRGDLGPDPDPAKSKSFVKVMNPTLVEAIAIKEVLSLAKEMKWYTVTVESDCLVVIQLIKSA